MEFPEGDIEILDPGDEYPDDDEELFGGTSACGKMTNPRGWSWYPASAARARKPSKRRR